MRAVVVCTSHRGVFFGRTVRSSDEILRDGIISLTGARMLILWGTTKGVMQLAATGPTSASKIGAQADIGLNAVTAVFECSEAASAAWDAVP